MAARQYETALGAWTRPRVTRMRLEILSTGCGLGAKVLFAIVRMFSGQLRQLELLPERGQGREAAVCRAARG